MWFDKVGVRVIDTGEELTCIQYADSATFHEGIDKNDVDFIVDIYSYQVDRLASHVRTGEASEVEQFRIPTTLFTPIATAGFNNPTVGVFMTGRFFSWFIKRKNITHMYFISPEPVEEPDIHYSLLFINRQWLLVPDFYGKPERVFKIEKQKGLELHRKMFSGTIWTIRNFLRIKNMAGNNYCQPYFCIRLFAAEKFANYGYLTQDTSAGPTFISATAKKSTT